MNLANTIWWCQFWWRDKWIPKPIAKFGWETKIRLTQDTDFPWRWVHLQFRLLIIWSSPNWEVMSSIFEPSKVVLSPVYQFLDIALKSPIAAIKKRLIATKASGIRSKLSQKFWKLSLGWFGDLYKETKFQFLSLSFIAVVIHSLY